MLGAEGKLCPTCSGLLQCRVIRETAPLDDDTSKGQSAAYFAAMESGEHGEWAVEAKEWFFEKCEPPVQRALRNFFSRKLKR